MAMTQWRERGVTIGVCVGLLLLVAVSCTLSLEDSVAMLVCAFFFGLGVILLSLIPDERERTLMLRLFMAAFLLRLVFTLLAYALDLIRVIGGADDEGWQYAWAISRYWRHYLPDPPNVRDIPGVRPPNSFLEVLSGVYGKNRGWFFYVGYLFNLIDTPSQIALAFVNTFLSSLTPCVIYRVTRSYFSEKASLIAAGAAVIFPGFIAWSALTIKEPWLIFLEIFVFYLCWESFRSRRWVLLALAFFLVLVTYSMRFYVGYVMIAALPFIVLGTRSTNPRRSALTALAGVVVAYILGSMAGVIHVDVISIVTDQMQSLRTFGNATSGANGTNTGVSSGVVLPYDPSTPQGALMLLLVGMAYLLLSPFPWSLGGKQILALPDVAIWWVLVFAYILPGIPYAWKKYPGLSIAILSYLAPLILVYSFSFGNIGLAYRQRAQLMPFFLFFAAAGYDARRKKKGEAKGQPSTEDILERLRQMARTPAPQSLAVAPEPALRSNSVDPASPS